MLTQKLTCHPNVEEIQEEKDVRRLLENVKTDLGRLNCTYKNMLLTAILRFVEKGSALVPHSSAFFNEVDLSQAQGMLSDYRKMSEGGCYSCKNVGIHKPNSDDAEVYCELKGETPGDVCCRTGRSPMVEAFYNNENCAELEHKFSKKIEEIISE